MKLNNKYFFASVALILSLQAGKASAASTCEDFQKKFADCNTTANTYAHGAWKLFQAKMCEANFLYTSYAEQAFCMVDKDLAISLTLGSSAVTTTKSFNSKTIAVTLETPTEAFATTAGYTAKMTIVVDSQTQTVVWWDGKGATTKGYAITSQTATTAVYPGFANPIAVIVQWDRTDPAAQTVEYWGTSLGGASYLTYNATAPDLATVGRYGQISFDSVANKVNDLQVVTQQNRLGSSGNTAACYRQRAWGHVGATTEHLATFNTSGGTPEQTNSTDVDGVSGSGADTSQIGTGEVFPDDVAWPNGTNLSTMTAPFTTSVVSGAGTATGPGAFSKSCDDVLTTSLFGTATTFVDFTTTPSAAGF